MFQKGYLAETEAESLFTSDIKEHTDKMKKQLSLIGHDIYLTQTQFNILVDKVINYGSISNKSSLWSLLLNTPFTFDDELFATAVISYPSSRDKIEAALALKCVANENDCQYRQANGPPCIPNSQQQIGICLDCRVYSCKEGYVSGSKDCKRDAAVITCCMPFGSKKNITAEL